MSTFGIILAAVLASGCGTASYGNPAASPSPYPIPTLPKFPKTMNPAWISGEASNDGGMDPTAAASLHGWVNLTNVSAKPCTLNGVPTVTLFSHAVPVQVTYGKFGTGQAIKVGLPAHGAANFRIDWGAPYCPNGAGIVPAPPDPGPFSLRAVINGVTLDIAVHSTASPGCNLRALRATASGYPSQIAPGQLLKFVITLSNPTGAPVSLTAPPPAGYSITAYCARTPSTPGYQFARPYSLDTGPRPAVAAHGAVRFAMQLAIPALTCPTGRLAIGWFGGPPAFTVGGTAHQLHRRGARLAGSTGTQPAANPRAAWWCQRHRHEGGITWTPK